MDKFAKPTVLLSKCIEFDHCRYDGSIIASEFVKKINPYVRFLHVCPEVEIGLGIPRKSLRLVGIKTKKHLIQSATKKDVTTDMIDFATAFLSEHSSMVHGVILKSRSPSCGIKDVKLYTSLNNAAIIKKTAGLFGEIVLNNVQCAVETEGRLRNNIIQEHFLTSIFTLADFEDVKKNSSISNLASFHTKNKFLFMAYKQETLRKMGRIVANQNNDKLEEILNQYEILLYDIFKKPPSHDTTINVLLHIFGFVSEKLNKSEKEFFLDLIDSYKHEKINLTVLTHVLKSWVVRFSEPYLSNQTIFLPFPKGLLDEDVSIIADRQRYWE